MAARETRRRQRGGTEEEGELTLDAIQGIDVLQPGKGYRFGVEAPLLANFAAAKRFRRAVEFGTGVGVVAMLVAAQRKKGMIDAVEIQARFAELARRNILRNGLADRIAVVEGDAGNIFKVLSPGTYDLVFGNPPFQRPGSGRRSPLEEVELARREIRLSLEDWISSAAALLRNGGRCCIVHDAGRCVDLVALLRAARTEPKRLRFVHHGTAHGASLVLVEGIREGRRGIRVEPPLFIDQPGEGPGPRGDGTLRKVAP